MGKVVKVVKYEAFLPYFPSFVHILHFTTEKLPKEPTPTPPPIKEEDVSLVLLTACESGVHPTALHSLSTMKTMLPQREKGDKALLCLSLYELI